MLNIEQQRYKTLLILLIFTFIIPIVIGILIHKLTADIRFVSMPIHSVLEASGGIIALLISLMFFIIHKDSKGISMYHKSGVALIFMGVLDIFHASVPLGKSFVWLHTMAVFLGGLLFAFIWIEHRIENLSKKFIFISSFLIAISIGILSIIYIDYIPAMVIDGEFSSTASYLNLIGGIGFFIASIKYIKKFNRDFDFEDILLAGHLTLFGVAGILFFSSQLWDMQWWYWHFLRLLAYLISLSYLVSEYVKTIDNLHEYMQIVDEHVIVLSTDENGFITNVSSAFSKVTGYTQNELKGLRHNILKSAETSKETHKNLWQTIQSGKSWYGELQNRKKDGNPYWTDTYISPRFLNGTDTVIGYIAIYEDITDKKLLEKLSITDDLTQLYNRGYFNRVIQTEINRNRRSDTYISFLIMDIDNFKLYNDTYGHQEGDRALTESARVIRDSVYKTGDFAFRLGGEEFGILFSGLDNKMAFEFADKIRREIENLQIEHLKNVPYRVLTISMGLVTSKGESILSDEELYKLADNMLYKSKKSGRNRVSYYQES